MSMGYALCSQLVRECLKASFRPPAQADNSFCEARTFAEQTLELVRFFERLPRKDASLKNTVPLRSTEKGADCNNPNDRFGIMFFEPVGRCFFCKAVWFWNKTVKEEAELRELALRQSQTPPSHRGRRPQTAVAVFLLFLSSTEYLC